MLLELMTVRVSSVRGAVGVLATTRITPVAELTR
jgi:hypothetical protein